MGRKKEIYRDVWFFHGAIHLQFVLVLLLFPFSALTLLVGDRKDIRPVKKLECWFVGGDDFTGVRLIAPVVSTASIDLSSSKIQNWDDPPGKWPLKRRDVRCISYCDIGPVWNDDLTYLLTYWLLVIQRHWTGVCRLACSRGVNMNASSLYWWSCSVRTTTRYE